MLAIIFLGLLMWLLLESDVLTLGEHTTAYNIASAVRDKQHDQEGERLQPYSPPNFEIGTKILAEVPP